MRTTPLPRCRKRRAGCKESSTFSGVVVPVVGLGLKFDLEERPVKKTTCIVIVEGQVEGQSTLMGVMADAVSQVMDIAAGDVQEVPTFGTRIKVDYLQGMAQLGKKFVLLLDIDKVLSADEVSRPYRGGDDVVGSRRQRRLANPAGSGSDLRRS